MLDYKMSIKVLSMENLIKAGCFNMKEAISVVEEAFIKYSKGDIIFPDKISVVFDEDKQNRINCLPAAILSDKVYGMKWISVYPDNPHDKNIPNVSALYLLSELETGYPLALLEGSFCSNLRTAAVGALAARYFAKKDARIIGFIGAGEQAKTHFLSMMQIADLKVCKVASRTQKSETVFVNQMKEFYPDVEFIACDGDYREAVADADIIVTAISGQEKILQADWIKEGAFYCHVAGLEDDFSVALRADKIVCDKWETVKHRTQTISQMYKLGILSDDSIYADLDEVIMGLKPGREKDNEFIYFNSVGMSFVDTALAFWMYKKANEKDLGMCIDLKQKSMFDIS